jgi:hypothetical protein
MCSRWHDGLTRVRTELTSTCKLSKALPGFFNFIFDDLSVSSGPSGRIQPQPSKKPQRYGAPACDALNTTPGRFPRLRLSGLSLRSTGLGPCHEAPFRRFKEVTKCVR